MRPRGTVKAAILLVIAAAAGACGTSAGPTTAPTPSSAPSAAPATLPTLPTEAPLPTFAVPSFVGDEELEAMFPADIAGEPLTVVSIAGTELPQTLGGQQLMDVLEALHKTPADLSVAFTGTSNVTIQAFRVKGVPATKILPAIVAVYQQGSGSISSQATFAGKSVTKFTPTSGSDPAVYLYLAGDTVFTVGGANATDALLTEVFSKLP
jgi:hypothetical protein